MYLLKKNWARIIFSLFAGGVTSEIIHISTGDPNRPMEFNLSILYAVIIYIILTKIINTKSNKN